MSSGPQDVSEPLPEDVPPHGDAGGAAAQPDTAIEDDATDLAANIRISVAPPPTSTTLAQHSPSPTPSLWRELRRGLRDVFFPPVCLGCGGVPDGGELEHVCPACATEVLRAQPPACAWCGHPFFGQAAEDQICPHCEGLKPEYGGGRTAVLFRGPVRALVHELKYNRGLYALRDIERLIASCPWIIEWVRDAVLVPVPLHRRKLRERGYNQAAELAGAFSRAAGGSTRVEPLLARVRYTESQTHFDRATRRTNLKNAFALAPGHAVIPKFRYVIVDDVFTTGSTLNSCASALRRAGGVSIDVVTFGHG